MQQIKHSSLLPAFKAVCQLWSDALYATKHNTRPDAF